MDYNFALATALIALTLMLSAAHDLDEIAEEERAELRPDNLPENLTSLSGLYYAKAQECADYYRYDFVELVSFSPLLILLSVANAIFLYFAPPPPPSPPFSCRTVASSSNIGSAAGPFL